MEDEEGGLPKLSKRFADKGGEVDYKTTSGTAWSHSYLNQKPWHPLSYPNQRRKWIAEQTHAQRQRRLEEVSREYTQEQEFLRQTSLLSQKDKEKGDIMQAVSFMYVRPPGYNAESAKAAEIVDEQRKLGDKGSDGATSSSMPQETAPAKDEKKKPRPKDVFGRALPTEEEFAVLKNAPRLETGVAGRAKPFAVEVRNVKCVRCGNFGHQSGDRECPLKDVIMPNEESRLKRDDPLTAIMAQVEPSEPLKWELKQKPGISPPRGGFQPDDPNQQIVAEDIFDEYGGFLSGGVIPELLTNFSSRKHKKKKTKSKSKHNNRSPPIVHEDDRSDSDHDLRSPKTKSKSKKKENSTRQRKHDDDYSSDSDSGRRRSKRKLKSDHRHNKRGSVTDSDGNGGSDRDDDLRSLKAKRKSKQKEASSRSRKEGDDHTSDSDYGRRSSKTKSKSSYRHRKLGSVTDSDDDSKGYENRRSRKEHIHKNEKHSSNCRMSEGSEGEKYQRASPVDSEHGRKRDDYSRKSRKEHAHKREKHISRYRMSEGVEDERYHAKDRRNQSPTRIELKQPCIDGVSDRERTSRRKDKRHRKHKTTRSVSDSEFSSSEYSEPDRHRRKHRIQ